MHLLARPACMHWADDACPPAGWSTWTLSRSFGFRARRYGAAARQQGCPPFQPSDERPAPPSVRFGALPMPLERQTTRHLPPALLEFPLFQEELGDALTGVDNAEEALVANPSDPDARATLATKVATLGSALKAAVAKRCWEEKDIVPRCVAVIEMGHAKFQPVYDSTFENIASSEEEGMKECAAAVSRIREASKDQQCAQRTEDVVELYAAAASIRGMVTQLMQGVAEATQADLAVVPEKARPRRGLKQVVRIVEKCALRPDKPGKAERICDVVRDMFTVSSMEQMARVAEALLACSDIRIVRVKDRNIDPSGGGWRDIMINYVVVGDKSAHVCEAQLVHKKMKLQRTEQDGHLYYNRVRIATEVLEKLGLLKRSERPARIEELRASGTTAAVLKLIGGEPLRLELTLPVALLVPQSHAALLALQSLWPTCSKAVSPPKSFGLLGSLQPRFDPSSLQPSGCMRHRLAISLCPMRQSRLRPRRSRAS